MSHFLDPRSILKHPFVYTSYQKLVGGYKARRLFVEKAIKIEPGQKILDIGCGPGDILDFLPEVDYTGIDADQEYIKKAKEKYSHRGTFMCTKAGDYNLNALHDFDLVIAAGVLHHLNDEEVTALFQLATNALRSGGRFVSMDGCYIPDQNKISKYFLKKDRGQFVRTQNQYEDLAQPIFSHVNSYIEESYFNIPYTLLILDCN